MIKVYKRDIEGKDWSEIKVVNMETGDYTSYNQDKNIGYTFNKYQSNITEMGYRSVKDCIKTLKSRNFLGKEIDYKAQRESERIGLIKLGVERIRSYNRVNTKDFEDIIEKLKGYGMNFVDAQNIIIAAYEHQHSKL